MANMTNREVTERYGRAIVERDLDTMDQLRHADYVSEYPQSGERIRGTANARAMHEHYPGGLPRSESNKIHGGEDTGSPHRSGLSCISREPATCIRLWCPSSMRAKIVRGISQ